MPSAPRRKKGFERGLSPTKYVNSKPPFDSSKKKEESNEIKREKRAQKRLIL